MKYLLHHHATVTYMLCAMIVLASAVIYN